ncbi:hypothetical protein DEU56DRAFT_782809 [Suillus clintonianus]|uniref:uncharacterized protein n=1 Tax=Suillus clintonianus TaxID=1904413 RepID=UPI001B87A27F|nr:uncharacterized protein DEU56DRAFT_782809 [Suillus clintonianus]KAG2148908.1 hypothetical protein DEU56DRAFT_782809 [Suillus clintonianus]
MNITDALGLSPTNRLTLAERKAFGKSDHKAAKILGITLTRNHVRHANDRRLALVPSADQENAQTLGEMILTGAKRSRCNNSSAVAIIRPLMKNLGLGRASGIGMALVEKRNKNRRAAGEHAQRVILGPLRSNESPIKETKELSTTVTDDSACSFLELDEIEDAETPLTDEFVVGNDEEEEDVLFRGFPGGFVWDVENPFATPPEEGIPALYSDNSFDDMLRPAERAYLDYLIEKDEAEVQPMERRKQRRAAMRSRNKMLDVLGIEARQAVDAQY